MAENGNKIILLKLWEYLHNETDEDHPVSRIELAEKLGTQGVPCHIRTISRGVETLIELGYDSFTARTVSTSFLSVAVILSWSRI